MTGFLTHQRYLAVCMLLLAAVMLRGLIPAGFMPDHRINGQLFPMVVCTSMGSKTVYVDAGMIPDMPSHEKHQLPASEDPSVCGFAAVFAMGILPVAPVLTSPDLSDAAYQPAMMSSRILFSFKPYQSHGPPVVTA